jgi:hypothetical protein
MTAKVNYLFAIVLLAAACGGRSDNTPPEEIIAGKNEKTWRASRLTNAQGDQERLNQAEQTESITFSRNGSVQMSSADQSLGGTWSYSNSQLTLQFTGAEVSENFQVMELRKDLIRLRAADGSELNMKPD